MKTIHSAKKAQTFKDNLQARGYKSTQQRNRIFEIFAQINHSISADEFYRQVKKRLPRIGFATVYRTLKLLERNGLASKLFLNDGLARYQPSFAKHKEAFFFCEQCSVVQKIDQKELELWFEPLVDNKKYSIRNYRLEINGLCSSCKQTLA